jgi:hypothetical protein
MPRVFSRLPQRLFIVGLSIAVLLGALSFGGCGDGGPKKAPSPGSLTSAIERHDGSALVASLGGDPADGAARAAADALLAALPQGTTVRLVVGSANAPRVTYEVTLPGGASSRVSFRQVEVDKGGILLVPATEEAP